MDPDVEGIYLLSDGLPNNSTQEVLRHAAAMIKDRDVKIHTISYNSNSSEANVFLEQLAADCDGRYHEFFRLPKPTDRSYVQHTFKHRAVEGVHHGANKPLQ